MARPLGFQPIDLRGVRDPALRGAIRGLEAQVRALYDLFGSIAELRPRSPFASVKPKPLTQDPTESATDGNAGDTATFNGVTYVKLGSGVGRDWEER
jgi:hypothetical protein